MREKIVFLGDSLTQAGTLETGYITVIGQQLRAEGLEDKYELVGKGIGGNMVRHLLARFEKDVIDEKPSKVVLLVGINDIGFFTWHPEEGGTPRDQFESALTYMVQRLKQKRIQVVLCTPTVIEEKPYLKRHVDQTIDQYADICRKVAKQNNIPLCDLRKAFTDYLNKHNRAGAEKVLTTDYVHMNPKGDSLIAMTMYPYILNK